MSWVVLFGDWGDDEDEPWGNGNPGADFPRERPDHYFEIEVPPMLRYALLDCIEGRRIRKTAREILRALVMDARRVDRPYSSQKLPWDEIEREAQRQGIGPADVIWDKAKGKEES